MGMASVDDMPAEFDTACTFARLLNVLDPLDYIPPDSERADQMSNAITLLRLRSLLCRTAGSRSVNVPNKTPATALNHMSSMRFSFLLPVDLLPPIGNLGHLDGSERERG